MTSATRGRRRVPWPAVLLVVGVLAVAAVAGNAPASGPPLDPDSTGPDGAAAVVEALARSGVAVEVVAGEPTAEADRALVLADPGLDPTTLATWLGRGSVLVIADPTSPLHPLAGLEPSPELQPSDGPLVAACDDPALAGLVVEASVAVVEVRSLPSDALTCFSADADDGGGWWLVAVAVGDGVVVGLADPTPLLNGHLDRADHAAVVASLLGSSGRVEVVRPARPGEGPTSLRDLVPPGVKAAIVQAGLAALLYAVVRARRHGMPVTEVRPVEVPSASLVRAVAGLRHRSGHRGATLDRVAASARHRLARVVGTDPADGAGLHDAVGRRIGRSSQDVAAVLDPDEPPDDAALLAAARSIHRVIEQVEAGDRG